MAIVTFLQTTDMNLLPTSGGMGNGSGSANEIDVHAQFDLVNACILGTFVSAPGEPLTGTVTRVMIDYQDSGEFPNLDITGLSFTSSDDIRMRALSNPQQFVADLLAANDTLIGSPG